MAPAPPLPLPVPGPLPPKTTPVTAGGKPAVNLADITIPRWCKEKALSWVEIFDQGETTVIGYAECIVETIDTTKKVVKLSYLPPHNGPAEVLVTRLLERSEEPLINDDLVDIEPLNDAELLRCLEIRYKRDMIYCFCGPSLLSTNPYKPIENPTEKEDREIFKRYALNGGKRISKPHIWNMSAIVFWQLIDTKVNQAICISGESGAGKSHSTRDCLGFITKLFSDRQPKGEVAVEDKILSCNPIMESFGNAKTIRNNDSSRFGKYFLLFADLPHKQLRGSKIEIYLLEKSRVVMQNEGERNYHIFYAVLKHMSSEEQVKYKLCDSGIANMDEYPFLTRSTCKDVAEINDKKIYEEVRMSFNNLGFTPEEQESIWKLISVVLNLGNVEVDASTYRDGEAPSRLKPNKALDRVLSLLELKKEDLEAGLCKKNINADMQVIFTPDQVDAVKLALAKDLFNSVFQWMVFKCNLTLLPPNSQSLSSVGVLDIFGFEDFTVNSLEQLCINYTNERLQRLYINCVFTAEQKIFIEEGLEQHKGKVKAVDNKELLETFESKTGLFQLVDSSCTSTSDNAKAESTLIGTLNSTHQTNPLMSFDKMKPHLFYVRHTAKRVLYSALNFPEKNRDELPQNLYEAIGKGNRIIYRIFKCKLTEEELKADEMQKKDTKTQKTILSKFKQSIMDLMTTLESSGCNFIRCLKPNEDKLRDNWNPVLFLTQIKYMGILDSIRVRRESFPMRKPYRDFYAKYQDLDTISPERNTSFVKLNSKPNVDWKALAMNVVKSLEAKTPKDQVLFGKTRVFMNIVYQNRLEELLEDVQKNQRACTNKIALAFMAFDFINHWNKHRRTCLKVVGLSRTLLNTWNSKIDYKKFQDTLKVLRHVQWRFRFTKYLRNNRLKKYSIRVIGKAWSISRMRSQLIKARRMLNILQKVLARLRMKRFLARVRINKAIMNDIFERAWVLLQSRIMGKSCESIQRIWRGHLARLSKFEDFEKLRQIQWGLVKERFAVQNQKIVRGFLIRARLHKARRMVNCIKGAIRMVIARRYFKLIKDAVRKIKKAFKKYRLRNNQIKIMWSRYKIKNREFMQEIKTIEHDVIFRQEDSFYNLKNLENYTKVRFFEDKKDFREYIPKIESFIPPTPAIDLNPKMRLFSILIDFDCHVDSSDIYKRSWAVDYLNYQNSIREKGGRLMHLEAGSNFTLAVDDDLKIYSWGINDQFQLCRSRKRGDLHNNFPEPCKLLNHIAPRLIASGDDHTLLLDYCNELYVWGDNTKGQFGLGHPREVSSVVHLKMLGNKTQYIASQGTQSYIITEDGSLYSWPNPETPALMYVPSLVRIAERSVKFTQISCGRNFALGISATGVLFGQGANKYGQLGTGDTEERKIFTPVETLRYYGEKISEVSCGFAHVICKTNTDKVYTWGYGGYGQLGLGQNKSSAIPAYIKNLDPNNLAKARSVQAGVFNSWVLLDNKKVLIAGLNSKSRDNLSLTFKLFEYEKKVFNSTLGQDLIPLKIYSKWSKSVTLTYLMVADFRKVKNTTGIRDKIVDQVSSKWEEVYNQMFPPFTEAIYKNICPKYIRKINPSHDKTVSELYTKHTVSGGEFGQSHPNETSGRNKSRTVAGTNKENSRTATGVFQASTRDKHNNSSYTGTGSAREPKYNPYDMKDPRFDKSYENMQSMRQRLIKLQTIDESLWTADDKLLVTTMLKM